MLDYFQTTKLLHIHITVTTAKLPILVETRPCTIHLLVTTMRTINSKLVQLSLASLIRFTSHWFRHYSNRYNYSNEHYPASHSTRLNVKKTSKRGGGVSSSTPTNPHDKPRLNNGNGNGNGHNNNNNSNSSHNVRHHSTSDNDQKEGEEWETASESSTNMRNGHHENNGSSHTPTTTVKSIHSARTQPKKNFHSQR